MYIYIYMHTNTCMYMCTYSLYAPLQPRRTPRRRPPARPRAEPVQRIRYKQMYRTCTYTYMCIARSLLFCTPIHSKCSLRRHWSLGERGLRVLAYGFGAGVYFANTGIIVNIMIAIISWISNNNNNNKTNKLYHYTAALSSAATRASASWASAAAALFIILSLSLSLSLSIYIYIY